MGARILVVEDNAANLELMTYLLTAFGHSPQGARDGPQGVALATRDAFDIVICDIQLPGLDGFEVMRAIRSRSGHTMPLVAVTAFAQVGDRERVLEAGFDGYISKPIVPETFVEQVEAFLPADRRGHPAAQAQAQRETARPAPQATRGSVLVVDNVPENVELMRSLLEPFGYRVTSASGVAAALRELGERAPDLIVSDVHLADGTGFELLEAVQRTPERRAIPFVFVSTTARQSEEAARGRALGARAFIVRPIEPTTLLAELQACIGGR
jgi:two-component system cell cycle response regulator